MATATDFSKTAQDQVLAAVKQSQEFAIAGVELWAAAVAPLVSNVANVSPSVPSVDLPKPSEFVATSFGFAEKLLASQKDFAQKLVAASAPVFEPKTTTTATKAA